MTKKKKITAIILAIVFVVIVVFGCVLFIKIIPDIKAQREWDEYVKNYYAQKISLYEQENAQYGDYEVDVAFLGDSLTDGYDLQKYFPEYKTSNRGIGGDTTVERKRANKPFTANVHDVNVGSNSLSFIADTLILAVPTLIIAAIELI